MASKRWTPAELRELASASFDDRVTRDAVREALTYAARMLEAADAVVRESQRRTAGVSSDPQSAVHETPMQRKGQP